MEHAETVAASTMAIRLTVTFLFVLLNGFFVAAEFALVKVRGSRLQAQADRGNASAKLAHHMLQHLDLYLSSCQLGITVCSLILGWLAEPAVAQLLLAVTAAVGLPVGDSALLHGVALALALAIVTILHMTVGEQAPKIWAIQRAEPTSLKIARPLYLFTLVFRPLIWFINLISNWLLRMAGVTVAEIHEGAFTADELRAILAASAQAGSITARQREFAENILGFVNLQVRHILVPRVDVVSLSTRDTTTESLRTIRESQHSRLPLCEGDLDETVGMVHAKDVLAALADGREVDLRTLSRPPVLVPDTQPLGRMIVGLQRERSKAAMVLDDHGTVIGMAFLEDALEEIVGPIQDEFDDEEEAVIRPESGVIEMRGSVPLPEAVALLGLDEEHATDDTIGGHLISVLGRLPESGEQLSIGPYKATVVEVSRRRVLKVRFDRAE